METMMMEKWVIRMMKKKIKNKNVDVDNDNNLDDDDNNIDNKKADDNDNGDGDDNDDDNNLDGMGDKNDDDDNNVEDDNNNMGDKDADPDDNNNIDEDDDKNNNSDDDEINIDNDNNIDENNPNDKNDDDKDDNFNEDKNVNDENEADETKLDENDKKEADEENATEDKHINEDKIDDDNNVEKSNETKVESNFNIKPDSLLGSKTIFKLYHRGSNYRDKDDPEGTECPVKWKWVDEQKESDIIVMNVLDNMKDIVHAEYYNYDKSRQKLLLMSMESVSNYPIMDTKKKYFDYSIDYRLDSDVPIPYAYEFFDFKKPALPTKEKGKNGRGLAAVFISNCFARNKRMEFLNQLMKHMKVDSFGFCSNNKDVYEEDEGDNNWNTKMNTIRKYKFTLAFENSNDRDYVTEKFFQPLEAGSVPVFFGTSNIADFAPPNSYINAKDFESPKELAKYLKMLDKNDEEYEKYLEWKKKGLGDNLNHVIEVRKLSSICHLLQRIKGLWINPYLTIWDRKDVAKDERACGIC